MTITCRLYKDSPVWRSALRAYGRRLRRLFTMRRFDPLWIENKVIPLLPAWLERIAIGSVPYVLDFHDARFLRYRQHPSRLRGDPSLRLELGMAGRRVVENGYCVQVTAGMLADALYAAAGRAR